MSVVERLTVPFTLRGHSGRFNVALSTNDDPVALGHPLVAANFDADAFKGFPVVLASVDYGGTGLLAWMGWVQVIRHLDAAGTEVAFEVDRFPLGPDDSPLYAYGYVPTFFDAPANPEHQDGVWQADTWLVAVPDVIRSRRLAPLAGFRWGYRLRGRRPALLPLESVGKNEWRGLLPRLREQAPRWEFLEV